MTREQHCPLAATQRVNPAHSSGPATIPPVPIAPKAPRALPAIPLIATGINPDTPVPIATPAPEAPVTTVAPGTPAAPREDPA